MTKTHAEIWRELKDYIELEISKIDQDENPSRFSEGVAYGLEKALCKILFLEIHLRENKNGYNK